MDPGLLTKLTEQVLSTGNLALTILFGGCVYLARQLAKERDAREKADMADRAFAEEHTKALYALGTVLAEIKGVLTNKAAGR